MSILLNVEIEASLEAVWAKLSDHATLASWAAPESVRLTHEGEPAPNGEGAIRVVKFPGAPAIEEEIIRFDEAPGRCAYHYKIIPSTFPGLRDHLGKISAVEDGLVTRVTWEVELHFKGWHPVTWFLTLSGFKGKLKRDLQRSLDELKRQLEG